MRFLIDGYNLMHAKGLMQPNFRGDGLHRARLKFLVAVVSRLGPIDVTHTTVVFDAAEPPPNRPASTTYKGLQLVFAIGEENADAAIERMLLIESAPARLMVVSSDRRVREAARRRGSHLLDADAFWAGRLRQAIPFSSDSEPRKSQASPRRSVKLDPADVRQMELDFAEADRALADQDLPGNLVPRLLRDEEIRRLEREIANEDWEP